MSKSGSRYGRRSNWFKIHCLLQEQQQAAVAQLRGGKNSQSIPQDGPPPLLSPLGFPHPNLGGFLRPDNPSSPSVSSPDSDSSENGLYSPRVNGSNPFINKDFYFPVPFHSMFMQPPSLTSPFLLPPSLFPFPVPKHDSQRFQIPEQVQSKINSSSDLEEENSQADRPSPMHSPTNNNDYSSKNNNNKDICNNNNNNEEEEEDKIKMRSKRFYLDAILGLQTPKMDPILRSPKEFRSPPAEIQDDPIDLSVKKCVKKEIEEKSDDENMNKHSDGEEEAENDEKEEKTFHEEVKPIPLDLSV